MVLQLFSVYDSALGAYGRPFSSPSKGTGIRSFTDEVNHVAPENPLNRHPDDYKLFHLGSFNDKTGIISPPENSKMPIQLVTATEVLIHNPT